jgi:hypothetical protein
MEPTGRNGGVVQISVGNESVATVKNTFKALLWEILVKREERIMQIVNRSYICICR